MFNRLIQMWHIAEKDLGLDLVPSFLLTLSSGIEIKALFLLKYFGGEKGMLILTDYNEIDLYLEEIMNEGYGFSVLNEPRVDESYSRQDFIELLEDWGWSDEKARKPEWLE